MGHTSNTQHGNRFGDDDDDDEEEEEDGDALETAHPWGEITESLEIKRRSKPEDMAACPIESRGSCPVCHQEVTTAHLRVNRDGNYFHADCA